MDSLYPSLLGAIGVLGWLPSHQDQNVKMLSRELIWITLGYIGLVVTHLVGGSSILFWLFLIVGDLWLVGRIVLQLRVQIWPSILAAYLVTLVHEQVLSLYPFAFWRGVPVSYLLGIIWFLIGLSAGPDPRQKLLTLGLAFIIVGRFHFLAQMDSPDAALCNGFWLGLALTSFVLRIQLKFHSKFETVKPGM